MNHKISFTTIIFALSTIMVTATCPRLSHAEELSDAVLTVLELQDGWVSAEHPRKCANILISPDSELSPDLHVSREGRTFAAATSWESGDRYEITRIRSDWPTQLVLEMSYSGAGEGVTWTGRALWFVNYPWDPSRDTSEPPEKRVAKATSLTIVSWQESMQEDGQSSAQPVKDPIPGANTYVRCTEAPSEGQQ